MVQFLLSKTHFGLISFTFFQLFYRICFYQFFFPQAAILCSVNYLLSADSCPKFSPSTNNLLLHIKGGFHDLTIYEYEKYTT